MSYSSVGETGLDRLGTLTSAAKYILEDPALGQIGEMIVELHRLEQRRPTVSQPTPPSTPGIGLQRFVLPLKAYVYVRRNPWVLPVGVAALLAIPFLLGRVSK